MKANIIITNRIKILRTIAEELTVSVNILLKGIAIEIYYRWIANDEEIKYATLDDLIKDVVANSTDDNTITIKDYLCRVNYNGNVAILCIESDKLEYEMVEGLRNFAEELIIE